MGIEIRRLAAILGAEVIGLDLSRSINYPDKPPLTETQKAAYADVFHPLARRHPETGRTALFIGDVSAGTLEGLPEEEGDALLWDNRCTYHAATPSDQNHYRRHMHRTTIMDDRLPT